MVGAAAAMGEHGTDKEAVTPLSRGVSVILVAAQDWRHGLLLWRKVNAEGKGVVWDT